MVSQKKEDLEIEPISFLIHLKVIWKYWCISICFQIKTSLGDTMRLINYSSNFQNIVIPSILTGENIKYSLKHGRKNCNIALLIRICFNQFETAETLFDIVNLSSKLEYVFYIISFVYWTIFTLSCIHTSFFLIHIIIMTDMNLCGYL